MTEDLVSVRGLVDSDFENPLRCFTGTFDNATTAPATGYAGTRVELKFKDIDNVTVAKGFVYNFPTAIINVGLSNKNKSRWGYLANSVAPLIPEDEDLITNKAKGVVGQEGKVMSLVFCDGQDGRPSPKPIWNKDADPSEFPDKMVPTPVWVVESIEGIELVEAPGKSATKAGTAVEWAEKNLIGKTKAAFNKWAFADSRVRKDPALQRSISDKSFINALVQMGKVAEDENGVFQLAEDLPF